MHAIQKAFDDVSVVTFGNKTPNAECNFQLQLPYSGKFSEGSPLLKIYFYMRSVTIWKHVKKIYLANLRQISVTK